MRAGISCALRFKSERKIYPLQSCAGVPSSFSASRVRTPFGCELSNFGMSMNVSFCGLVSGLCPTYYGSSSISRPFSQIAKAGTRSHIITTERGGSGKNGPVNTFHKHRKSPKAFAAQKGNASSKEESANSSSSGKTAAVEDVDLSSIKGQIVKDNENTLLGYSAQPPKGRAKPKQSSNNKKQSHSSRISASPEAADMPNSSKKLSAAEETSKSKSKQSHVSPENWLIVLIQQRVLRRRREGALLKGRKSSLESCFLPKPNEELTGQSDVKKSPTPTSFSDH